MADSYACATWFLTAWIDVEPPPPPAAETRTLPFLLMVVLAVAGIVALGLLYLRKKRVQETVDAQFRGFREQAVALMDRLDALRQRHRDLPSTDPDFTEPMAGATRSLYERVGADLDALWERWLRVMEIWEQAKGRLRTGPGLGTGSARDARVLLESGHLDELLRLAGSCKEQLDRLNVAHERARAALKAGRAELATLHESARRGTGVLPSGDRNDDALAQAEATFREAEPRIVSDPIGAEEGIQRARQAIGAAAAPPQYMPGRPWGPATGSLFDELAFTADRLRFAVSRLRIFDLLGLFGRVWLFIWIAGLILALFTPVLPLELLALGLIVVLTLGGGLVRMLFLFLGVGGGGRR